jgi:hypothetical protein
MYRNTAFTATEVCRVHKCGADSVENPVINFS